MGQIIILRTSRFLTRQMTHIFWPPWIIHVELNMLTERAIVGSKRPNESEI
jgi:hypothetical protein